MERVLNLSDGWEDVVNDPEKREKADELLAKQEAQRIEKLNAKRERVDAFHAKRKTERIEKLKAKTMIAGMLGGCALILGATGALSAWLAVPAVFGFSYYEIFLWGRFREAKR